MIRVSTVRPQLRRNVPWEACRQDAMEGQAEWEEHNSPSWTE